MRKDLGPEARKEPGTRDWGTPTPWGKDLGPETGVPPLMRKDLGPEAEKEPGTRGQGTPPPPVNRQTLKILPSRRGNKVLTHNISCLYCGFQRTGRCVQRGC